MSEIIYRIGELLSNVVKDVPVGTNLGLAYLAWMMLSGRLLGSRGAVIPGLAALGLDPAAVRRSWAALCYGAWEIEGMMANWQAEVEAEGEWQAAEHEGWKAVAVDLTAFYRPRLRGLQTKHYNSQVRKALPAIPFGLAARVGRVGDVRIALPMAIERMPAGETDEQELELKLLERVTQQLAVDEVVVLDAGFKLQQLRRAQNTAFVLRVATNFTARRNVLPAYKGRGRPPLYGEIVRPLERSYRGNRIAATPPDHEETFLEDDCVIRVQYWHDLVGRDEKVGAVQPFSCALIIDPRFRRSLLVIYSVSLSGQALRNVYRERWPIEVLAQTAKQVIGAHRQFVFAETSRHRLPQLSLLFGSILSYVAASHPVPLPTGFWDRSPKPTSGRLRRVLSTVHFSDLTGFASEIRKKESATDHLPKGILAHRRTKPDDSNASLHTLAA